MGVMYNCWAINRIYLYMGVMYNCWAINRIYYTLHNIYTNTVCVSLGESYLRFSTDKGLCI